jgi:hypothetical protein
VTGLSRFPPRPARRSRRELVPAAVLAVWHAACSCLVTGCLYTAPVWRGDVNEEPIVIQPEGAEQDVFLFADLPVIVVAADPENDPLVFLWSAPGYPDLPSTERTESELTTSTAVIPYDPALDGRDVEVLIVDQSDAFNDVTVTFHVEVP